MPKAAVPEHEQTPHCIQIHDRHHMEITGVIEVCAFDELEVSLKTSRGHMCVRGKSLHVTSLSPESGRTVIDGTIDAVAYTASAAHSSILKRIFS